MDWQIGTGLALDWRIGNGLAQDWHGMDTELTFDWRSEWRWIDIGLALDWHGIGIGLADW